MHELPQSVRNRLAAQQTAGEHPDADLLTAFAEQALSGDERERVMAHLASCATCREVVSLALPVEEPASRVIAMPAPARTSWFTLPLVRWGIGIAAACIVLAAVILYKPQPARGPSEADLARITVPTPQAVPPPSSNNTAQPAEKKKETAAAPSIVAKEEGKTLDRSAGETVGAADENAESTFAARRHPPGPGGPSTQMSHTTGQLQQLPGRQQQMSQAVRNEVAADLRRPADAAGPAMAAPVPPPAAKKDEQAKTAGAPQRTLKAAEPVTVTTETARVESETQATAENRALSRPGAAGGNLGAAVGGMVAGVPRQKQAAVGRAPGTLWSITAGKLQKSSDGVQWATVDVAPNVGFRTVAVIGVNLWAGGSGGALYHSTDNGGTWERIPVGTPPTTDAITHLEFSDARTGTVTTASGAQWTTRDGGRSWNQRNSD